MKAHFVDVWQGRLDKAEERLERIAGLLSDAENRKAQSFKLALLRDRYILVRGFLRQTLAVYLGVEPVHIRYHIGEFGKPGLAGGGLHFNLSHSGDQVLIAVSDMSDIGVDMEIVKPRRNLDSLVARCCSAKEYAAWRQLAIDEQLLVFYRLWTKKEAFAKAIGRGIAVGIERCEFELETGGRLAAVPDQYGPVERWCVQELAVEIGFSAAVVTPNLPRVLRRLSLDRD